MYLFENVALWAIILFVLGYIFPAVRDNIGKTLILVFVLYGLVPSFIFALAKAPPGEKKMRVWFLHNSSWTLFLVLELLYIAAHVIILWFAGLPDLKWALFVAVLISLPVALASCFKKLMTVTGGK